MFILDTCTLLWLASDQTSLSVRALETIATGSNELFVSSISAFEIAIKAATGRIGLRLPADEWFAQALATYKIVELPVNGVIAARSAMLPAIHKDPCDRIIIATAMAERLVVLSPDRMISSYPDVEVWW
jgi:PIN domain nuclease of toxin-antitoxin system